MTKTTVTNFKVSDVHMKNRPENHLAYSKSFVITITTSQRKARTSIHTYTIMQSARSKLSHI